MKLFCIPYAGGGATAYRQMQLNMPTGIELVPLGLPGRDLRFGEPLIHDLSLAVNWLYDHCFEGQADQPYAIYGHSMGSLIAFELVRKLRRMGRILPVHLFLGARGAPHLSGEYERLSGLSDQRLIERLRAFGGMTEEALASAELMDLLMPVFRNDFRLLDGYDYMDAPALPVPITTFHGMRDSTVREEWITAWRTSTCEAYAHHVLPGHHFFLHDCAPALCNLIARELTPLMSDV